MARGQECRPEIPEIPGLAVAQDMMHFSRGSETRLHEACRGLREDCPEMMARVVAVRVRDEGEGPRASGIKPEAAFRQVNALVELDLHHGVTTGAGPGDSAGISTR